MLTLENVVIRQGDFTLHADFEIAPGSQLAVIGPSGAGKSTLLGAIAGFVPHSGRILWRGRDITALPPGMRPLSILFQDNNLFPHLTAAQNVGLGLRPDLRLSAAQQTQVAEALAQVGLDGYGPRKPGALSGGQQSRVAIARVLVQNRSLVLLDEPFSALGPALKYDLLNLVTSLAQRSGSTVFSVTHDPNDVTTWFDQSILVANGVAAAPQLSAELLGNPPPVLADYLGHKSPKASCL